jgi:hypothetical protein
LDRRLGRPQNRSGRGDEEKNSQPLRRLEPSIIQAVIQRYDTEISRLLYNNKPKTLCLILFSSIVKNRTHLERINKYFNLEEEVKNMWRLDEVIIKPCIVCTVFPAVQNLSCWMHDAISQDGFYLMNDVMGARY